MFFNSILSSSLVNTADLSSAPVWSEDVLLHRVALKGKALLDLMS